LLCEDPLYAFQWPGFVKKGAFYVPFFPALRNPGVRLRISRSHASLGASGSRQIRGHVWCAKLQAPAVGEIFCSSLVTAGMSNRLSPAVGGRIMSRNGERAPHQKQESRAAFRGGEDRTAIRISGCNRFHRWPHQQGHCAVRQRRLPHRGQTPEERDPDRSCGITGRSPTVCSNPDFHLRTRWSV
jgi:hypothetical protein